MTSVTLIDCFWSLRLGRWNIPYHYFWMHCMKRYHEYRVAIVLLHCIHLVLVMCFLPAPALFVVLLLLQFADILMCSRHGTFMFIHLVSCRPRPNSHCVERHRNSAIQRSRDYRPASDLDFRSCISMKSLIHFSEKWFLAPVLVLCLFQFGVRRWLDYFETIGSSLTYFISLFLAYPPFC